MTDSIGINGLELAEQVSTMEGRFQNFSEAQQWATARNRDSLQALYDLKSETPTLSATNLAIKHTNNLKVIHSLRLQLLKLAEEKMPLSVCNMELGEGLMAFSCAMVKSNEIVVKIQKVSCKFQINTSKKEPEEGTEKVCAEILGNAWREHLMPSKQTFDTFEEAHRWAMTRQGKYFHILSNTYSDVPNSLRSYGIPMRVNNIKMLQCLRLQFHTMEEQKLPHSFCNIKIGNGTRFSSQVSLVENEIKLHVIDLP